MKPERGQLVRARRALLQLHLYQLMALQRGIDRPSQTRREPLMANLNDRLEAMRERTQESTLLARQRWTRRL